MHHLHGNHHLRSSDRADPPGFHPCGHHPYHQPLGKPPAVPGRQLLGRDRGGPDQADRSRILAHGLPRDLRARRQVAHQVPARHREELPHQVSARIQRQRHQISRNTQRPGRPAQLHLGNDRLLEGRDAHGEQPHEQRDVRRNDNQHPDRTAVLPERRPHAVVPAAGPRLRLRVRLPRAAGRRRTHHPAGQDSGGENPAGSDGRRETHDHLLRADDPRKSLPQAGAPDAGERPHVDRHEDSAAQFGHLLGDPQETDGRLRRQRRNLHRRRRADEPGDRIVPDEDQVPDHDRLRHDRMRPADQLHPRQRVQGRFVRPVPERTARSEDRLGRPAWPAKSSSAASTL